MSNPPLRGNHPEHIVMDYDPASPDGDYAVTVYVCRCGSAMLTKGDCDKHSCDYKKSDGDA